MGDKALDVKMRLSVSHPWDGILWLSLAACLIDGILFIMCGKRAIMYGNGVVV